MTTAPFGSNGRSIELHLSRRGLLGALAALPVLTVAAPAAASARSFSGPGYRGVAAGFVSVAENRADTVTVPEGYGWQRLIAWGDPLFDSAAPAVPAARGAPFPQTRAEQEQRFGSYNDMLVLFPQPYTYPWPEGPEPARALMCVNHEAVSPFLCAPDATQLTERSARWTGTADQMEALYAAMGVSVVQLACAPEGGDWSVVKDAAPGTGLNRRITPFTEAVFSGPAASHPWIAAAGAVFNHEEAARSGPVRAAGAIKCGTMQNCAGGYTPWGTYLTAEENFRNQFFTSDPQSAVLRDGHAADPALPADREMFRYGGGWPFGGPAQYDLSGNPQGPSLYGWIVEIDPYDPGFTPRKHTALGRKQNECATTVIARDGRIAVYMGDDNAGEFVYRFVSKGRFNPLDRTANRTLLDEGTLQVARFDEDGSGAWLDLTLETVTAAPPIAGMAPFTSQGDVVVRCREAARRLGATHMDRPEDVQAPAGGDFMGRGSIYVVCTVNTAEAYKAGNAANPRRTDAAGQPELNRTGHILRIDEDHGDHTSPTFRWGLFVVGGDPAAERVEHSLRDGTVINASSWVDGRPVNSGDRFGAPDNICFDRAGYAWISTDGTSDVFDCNDGVYVAPLGTSDGPRPVKRFLTGPVGSEICGPFVAPGNRSFFCGIQHPGSSGLEGRSYRGGPGSPFSTFPDGGWPRDAVIVVRRTDGGPVGT